MAISSTVSDSNSWPKTGRMPACNIGTGSGTARQRLRTATPPTLWLFQRTLVNATLYQNLNYNFIRDITPVAGIFVVPLIMEVNPSFSAKSVPEFIAYAKDNPGKITMASSGIGSAQHVAGELFKFMTAAARRLKTWSMCRIVARRPR